MSLNAREKHALDSIEGVLADSDPKLAALLATFNRLTSGEDMPVRERILSRRRVRRARPARAGPRTGQRASSRRLIRRAAPLVWLVISVALIAAAVAVSLSGSGGRRACAMSVAVCGRKASTPGPTPLALKSAGSRVAQPFRPPAAASLAGVGYDAMVRRIAFISP